MLLMVLVGFTYIDINRYTVFANVTAESLSDTLDVWKCDATHRRSRFGRDLITPRGVPSPSCVSANGQCTLNMLQFLIK